MVVLLKVENLYKKYGRRTVLDDISFSIKKGEIVGFIGPNGAGKSTTMKCISGLEPFQSGQVEINGFDIVKQKDDALKYIGLSIESPGLYPTLTGYEHIKLFGKLRRVGEAKIDEIIEFANLGEGLKRRTAEYSMGMKQRLALSLALISSPSLLLLDEPTNGLDPGLISELRKELKALGDSGVSILYSSHQLDEVERICDRLIFIRKGKLVGVDTGKGADLKSYNFYLESVDGISELLEHKLSGANISLIGENGFTINNLSDYQLNEILKIIVNNGYTIMDIEENQLSLEERYADLYK
ncbi:MAG: ABC transporter ATP-binding protein [Eubacteriales bacterium]|nr:ABC transporter ATP-binding protein [Eubacteriales bacterium]